MASEYYTPVKPAANVDGQTADASDVNAISNAVETAFELFEADTVDLETTVAASAAAAAASETAAAASETAAAASETAAASSETEAAATLVQVENYYEIINPQVFTKQTFTSFHQVASGDHQSKILVCTSASESDVWVYADTFTENVLLCFLQQAAGQIVFTAKTGVTINIPTGFFGKTRAQGAGCTLWLSDVDNNIWELTGDLAADIV